MPQRTLSEALKYRARLLEDFTQGQLERINKYSECCTSARDRDRENFGWDFVGGLSTDEGRPYQNYSQYLNILRRSVGVFESSATMQGIAAKYISYVLGKEGAKYTVEKKPDKDICSLEELTNSSRTPLSFDQSDIKKMNCIIDVVSHTANDWLSLQKDGLWEYFRTGEMIRRTSELVKQKFPEVDIVTSFQVRPPNTTRTSLPTTNRSTTKINAEYGIRYVSGRPRTYYILDEGGESPVAHPVERIQHIKFGSQKKNPRAVPPFFVVRENADGIKQYEFGIRESFLARSLNSVIWELPPASAADGSAMAFLEARGYANEDIKSQARVGLPDGANGYTPDRSLTGEVHTTSKVVYPSPNLGADEVISLIKMEQTMIGLVVCMADYLSTGSSDTGNRATLQESGDPFTAAIIQGRTLLAKTDAELFWRILQIWFGWSESQLIAAQMQLEIKSNFSEIVKEDESKIANAASILVTANIWSKAQARRRTKVDPDQMKREIEQEKKEEPTPAQQQLLNGEQNGNGQPFQPKLDSPSEDEQTPSTPAEQIQNRRPQGTNPASTSNRSATEQQIERCDHEWLSEAGSGNTWCHICGVNKSDITTESLSEKEDNQPDASFPDSTLATVSSSEDEPLVEHTPGGKGHDQQTHGNRGTSTDEKKILPREVLYFGNVEVIQNPTLRDRQQLNKEVREAFPDTPDRLLNPKTRFTLDAFGNQWIWRADLATHSQIEPKIERLIGRTVNQNKPDIEESISEGEPLTEEVLEEFLGEVDNTGQQVSHNTVLENLQRAGYKIPENWQRRLQEHTPGGQDHDQKTHGNRDKGEDSNDNSDIEKEMIESGLTENANLDGLSTSEANAVLTSLQKSLNAGGRKLKLRNIRIASPDDPVEASFGFGYSNGTIVLANGLESARNHTGPKQFETGPEKGLRNFAYWEAANTEEYLEIAVAHEVGHHIETTLLLDLQRGIRESGISLTEDEIVSGVSGYASTHPSEFFAETHALVSTGRTVPKKIRDAYLSQLKTADPEPIEIFIREGISEPKEPNLQEALDMLNESLGLEDKEDCPQCQGTGLIGDDLCPSCKGTGNK